MHPVTAVQSEYSLWTRDPEAEMLPALASWASASCRSARSARVPHRDGRRLDRRSPRATSARRIPRFTAENRDANQALVDHVRTVADGQGATPGQVALAWLLAQQPWIVPIPGTRRRERLAENAGATQVALSADELADLDALAARVGVQGNRYNDTDMSMVGL